MSFINDAKDYTNKSSNKSFGVSNTSFGNTSFIMGRYGVYKLTCHYACADQECTRAHGNNNGSEVKNPRYCVHGTVATCGLPNCAFNHFRTEGEYVGYRKNDAKWRENNGDLAAKYGY